MLICWLTLILFFFKQKTAYEMRISDWSSDVCSSDLVVHVRAVLEARRFEDQRLQVRTQGSRAEIDAHRSAQPQERNFREELLSLEHTFIERADRKSVV